MTTNSSIRRITALVATAATIAALALSIGGPAQAETTVQVDLSAPVDSAVGSSAPVLAAGTSADEDYWTPERMAAAIPADQPSAAVTKTLPAGSIVSQHASTAPTDVKPATGSLAAKYEPLAAKVTRPYTNLPDRLNGRVFFTGNGVSYACSGTVVNSSSNKDLVDTAGHCVSDGAGHFYSHWIFVPGYASTSASGTAGRYPYGKWTARALTTVAAWHLYGDLKEDYGYAVLKPLGGKHITDLLGGNGVKFNQPYDQTWTTFGYPAAAPFTGLDQRSVVGKPQSTDDPAPGWPGPRTVDIASNLTPGCSGGGWIVGLSRTSGAGYINGHNSYRYVGGPKSNANRMYSPYYGADALALYNHAKSL